MIRIDLPIRTRNPLNTRRSWRAVAREARETKAVVEMALRAHVWSIVHAPTKPERLVVTLTRVSAGKMDAHDDLRAALKHCVDGVASVFGVDDGDAFWEWRYAQEKCARGTFGVRIEIQKEGEVAA